MTTMAGRLTANTGRVPGSHDMAAYIKYTAPPINAEASGRYRVIKKDCRTYSRSFIR